MRRASARNPSFRHPLRDAHTTNLVELVFDENVVDRKVADRGVVASIEW